MSFGMLSRSTRLLDRRGRTGRARWEVGRENEARVRGAVVRVRSLTVQGSFLGIQFQRSYLGNTLSLEER